MKTYPIALVPGPTSIPQRVRDAWNMDFGSSDLEGEFFELYADNQRLVQRLLGTSILVPAPPSSARTPRRRR